MKVKKKPVVVDAWPVSELNGGSIPSNDWSEDVLNAFILGILLFHDEDMSVETLEGTMKAPKGWYIIKGVNGEFYPCDPDVFNESYDVVS